MSNDNQLWASDQLTKEQAIALHDSKIWQDWTFDKMVRNQLFQKRLFLPFDKFHEAIEAVLKRPVFTHEFGDRHSLVMEYLGEKEPPTLSEIIDMIPAEKRIIIGI